MQRTSITSYVPLSARDHAKDVNNKLCPLISPKLCPLICQLMAAVGELCVDRHGRGLWDAVDEELLEAGWLFRRNYEAAVTPSRDDA